LDVRFAHVPLGCGIGADRLATQFFRPPIGKPADDTIAAIKDGYRLVLLAARG
jgi:hypothetical protein